MIGSLYNHATNNVSPSTARYIALTLENGALDVCQLEEGVVFTTYEPYKGTQVIYKTLDDKPVTLNRLPNGVYDEITDDGKLIKRVGEKTLVASDITLYYTGLSNVDYILIEKPIDYVYYNNQDNPAINGNMLMQGTNGDKVYADTTNNIGFIATISWIQICYFVAKGAYANLAAAQAALAGTKIIYQLAQPQILGTNATPLIAEPNGHVFITATASPQPSVELSYPINLGAVVEGLIEGQNQHSELLINQNAINLDFDLRITALEP